MSYDTYACIVSSQPDANFLTIFCKDTRPKKVLLFVSPEMKGMADCFEIAIKGLVQNVKKIQIDSAYDIVKIQESLMNCLFEYENENLIVNITGGTKPMSIATVNVCSQLGFPYFYQNVSSNEIYTWTEQPNDLPTVTSLPNMRLDFKRYLLAHDFEMVEKETKSISISKDEQEFFERMVKGANFGTAVSSLNFHASSANNDELTSTKPYPNDPNLDALLDKPFENNWISLVTKDGKRYLHFKSEDIRRFLNGTWLEKCIYQMLPELIGSSDIRLSLEVVHKGNKNELDIAFFYKNRLHIIEVKTCRFEKNNENQNIIHKLDSLADDLGGLTAKRCIVSFYPLYDDLKKRAKNKHIEVIDDSSVRNKVQLKGKLQLWINR